MSPEEYFQRFVHPEDIPFDGKEIQKAIETTDPNFSFQMEHRILYADGDVGYISARTFIDKDSNGKTVKLYGVNQDITERKRIAEELQAHLDFLENMDREIMDKLFEPFFTTKEQGKGTGLGLATVYGIVKQNEGFINVYSEPGHGTTLKIYLPRHKTKPGQIPKKSQAIPLSRGVEIIILVEDDMNMLELSKLMLERLGYRVLAASTPSEAIRIAKEYSGEIDLLITDMVMPEMNGRELVEKMAAMYPDLKYMYMSGYTNNVIAHHGVLDEGVNFI